MDLTNPLNIWSPYSPLYYGGRDDFYYSTEVETPQPVPPTQNVPDNSFAFAFVVIVGGLAGLVVMGAVLAGMKI